MQYEVKSMSPSLVYYNYNIHRKLQKEDYVELLYKTVILYNMTWKTSSQDKWINSNILAISLSEIYSWFHGKIDREDAEALLHPKQNGLYLVRESTNFPGDYGLCVWWVWHVTPIYTLGWFHSAPNTPVMYGVPDNVKYCTCCMHATCPCK